MKKVYEKPDIELNDFEYEDIITSSATLKAIGFKENVFIADDTEATYTINW